MVSGGFRVSAGATPNPNALRRQRDAKEWARLPREGCTLPVPDWPDEFGEASLQEQIIWNRLWATPQAVVWHNDGVMDTVVVYVRTLIEATDPQANATTRTSFRQLANELLLSVPAMLSARVFIEGGPEEAFMQDLDRAPAKPGTDGASNVRSMFNVAHPIEDDDSRDAGTGTE